MLTYVYLIVVYLCYLKGFVVCFVHVRRVFWSLLPISELIFL